MNMEREKVIELKQYRSASQPSSIFTENTEEIVLGICLESEQIKTREPGKILEFKPEDRICDILLYDSPDEGHNFFMLESRQILPIFLSLMENKDLKVIEGGQAPDFNYLNLSFDLKNSKKGKTEIKEIMVKIGPKNEIYLFYSTKEKPYFSNPTVLQQKRERIQIEGAINKAEHHNTKKNERILWNFFLII